MKYKIIYPLLLFAVLNIHGQNLKELYNKSVKAYEQKQYNDFKKYSLEALQFHPSQPTLLYNLVIAQLLTGEKDESKRNLEKLLSWKSDFNYKGERDLTSILNDEGLVAKLDKKANFFSTKKVSSSDFIVMPESKHLEDIEMAGNYMLAADVHSGELIFFDVKNGRITQTIRLQGAAMAIARKKKNNYVWASSSMIENYKNFDSENENESIIYKIDVVKKRIVKTLEFPNKAIIGSMVIDNGGILYATSSLDPEIYIIDANSLQIKNRIKIEDGFNLQGVTCNKDFLYVADYIKGILKVDLKDLNKRVWLECNNYLLKGIDGLTYVSGNKIIAIQNNSTPKRVSMLTIDNDEVINVELLDNALPYAGEPTNGKFYADRGFYYIANSQWPFYDKESRPKFEGWEKQHIRLIRTFD